MDQISFGQPAQTVAPGSFEIPKHYYPKVVNAQIHPFISYFFNLTNSQTIKRYCHLHPQVDRKVLEEILRYSPTCFRWAGADLFHVTTAEGVRQIVVIETNSCPSGQKSMPLLEDNQEKGGYKNLIEHSFKPWLEKEKDNMPAGKLAVIFDKNYMENSGYAATIADIFDEDVLLTPFLDQDKDAPVRFQDGIMEVRDEKNQWHPIRAAFRYVTQRPWNRIPFRTKTLIFNPILACLAGGRNKLVAAKAYDLYNAELEGSGIVLRAPETIRDVVKKTVPLWVRKFGGFAVIKVPYSNAGQGVYTITNDQELQDFMEEEHTYDRFIVQSLIGNHNWSTIGSKGRFYHIGTMPNKKEEIFVADLRFMVSCSEKGFRPLAIYSRKCRIPLTEKLDGKVASWDMLGTNLSVKTDSGSWDTETVRLLLMDRKDFNSLGIGLDELIEAYIQTVLSVVAIDRMSSQLITPEGNFRRSLFQSLNYDESLIKEILE